MPQKVMSALLPKADMCSALARVCFVPIADMSGFILGNNFTRVRNQPGHPL